MRGARSTRRGPSIVSACSWWWLTLTPLHAAMMAAERYEEEEERGEEGETERVWREKGGKK